jgi:hypothetical protein
VSCSSWRHRLVVSISFWRIIRQQRCGLT